jgi:aryl-alcohol dehydrogenase-like predicted oxidoreductase
MKYSELGRTGIQVSKLCLGSMTWGDQNTELEGHDQMDMAVDAGINFIDTAEMYPIPPQEPTYGRTELIIGTWLAKRHNRDKLVLATKITPPGKNRPWIRGETNKLDRNNIELAVNASLKRLQTDYIDLYQIHWPERNANNFGQLNYTHTPERDGTPIEETLEALEAIIKTGKVRHIGVSNETAWGLNEYLRVSDHKSLSRIVSVQNPYNLLNRTFEINMSEIALREQVGLLAYSPLGFGVLSGKYMHGRQPENARLTLYAGFKRYRNEQAVKITGKYVQLALDHGLQATQMALAFILTRPFLTSVIIGASSLAQLENNIDSLQLTLSDEILNHIEALHVEQPNPSP